MCRKEQPHEKILGLVEVIAKVGILDHHHFRFNLMLINYLLDPATDTVGVAGPAHHVENRFLIK